jgi:hypothetical protein
MQTDVYNLGQIERPAFSREKCAIFISHLVDGCAFSFAKFTDTEEKAIVLKQQMKEDREGLKRAWVKMLWDDGVKFKVYHQWTSEYLGVLSKETLKSGLERLASADNAAFNAFLTGEPIRSQSALLLKLMINIE